jgi:predicted DNA-binding ribbon-helix-helix protein
MVAIRNRNTNVPHVFRYPKWEQGIFYPAASLVAYQVQGTVDSDQSYWNFYTSLRDINPGEDSPLTNTKWYLIFDAEARGNDSDFLDRLEALENTHDSDIARIVHNYLANDSDIQDFLTRDHDSDIRVAVHNYLANDSDIQEYLTRNLDSEIRVVVHDYLASDSDLSERIIGGVWDYGSF